MEAAAPATPPPSAPTRITRAWPFSGPLASSLASAALMICAFPPVEWSWLAFVALVPLFAQVADPGPKRFRGARIYVGGVAFWLASLQWVTKADPSAALGWALMALVLGLYWPLAVGLARVAVHRCNWPLMLAAPASWVAMEYVRAYALTGFPWYNLAHTQYAVIPLIQVCDLGGAYLLSLFLALINAFWVDLGRVPPGRGLWARIAVAGGATLAVVGYGPVRLGHEPFPEGPKLGLLQSDIPQRYDSDMAKDPEAHLRKYARLVVKAANQRPDLIVWTETSYPYALVEIDPGITDAQLSAMNPQVPDDRPPSQWRSYSAQIREDLRLMAEAVRSPLLIGATTYNFLPEGFRKHNSAILVDPKAGPTSAYHKLHLVPFGEYVPLLETFPWLTALTPYRGTRIPSLAFGVEPGWIDWNGLRIGAVICFEDTVPQVVRRIVRASHKVGHSLDLLINLSNDGWFRETIEHKMHLVGTVFRAVEHRVPIARAVNTGISAIIDGDGRIREQLPAATESVLVGSVPLDPRGSFYTVAGDWVPMTCLGLSLAALPIARWRQRRVKRATPSSAASSSPLD